MSHGSPEWCRLLFICLCCAVVESVSEDGQAELSVPCTGPPEPWGGSSSPCPRSSRPSVWLRLRCCRPLRPTVGSSRSPPGTPSPPWSRRPCSRSSPRRRRVRPWCRPAGSGPGRWGPGPPLAAAWCSPPAGGAGRCCEVAGGDDTRETDVRWIFYWYLMHMFQSLFKQNEQTVDGSRFSDVSFAAFLDLKL